MSLSSARFAHSGKRESQQTPKPRRRFAMCVHRWKESERPKGPPKQKKEKKSHWADQQRLKNPIPGPKPRGVYKGPPILEVRNGVSKNHPDLEVAGGFLMIPLF